MRISMRKKSRNTGETPEKNKKGKWKSRKYKVF